MEILKILGRGQRFRNPLLYVYTRAALWYGRVLLANALVQLKRPKLFPILPFQRSVRLKSWNMAAMFFFPNGQTRRKVGKSCWHLFWPERPGAMNWRALVKSRNAIGFQRHAWVRHHGWINVDQWPRRPVKSCLLKQFLVRGSGLFSVFPLFFPLLIYDYLLPGGLNHELVETEIIVGCHACLGRRNAD